MVSLKPRCLFISQLFFKRVLRTGAFWGRAGSTVLRKPQSLGNLSWWLASLPLAVGWHWVSCEVPSNPDCSLQSSRSSCHRFLALPMCQTLLSRGSGCGMALPIPRTSTSSGWSTVLPSLVSLSCSPPEREEMSSLCG